MNDRVLIAFIFIIIFIIYLMEKNKCKEGCVNGIYEDVPINLDNGTCKRIDGELYVDDTRKYIRTVSHPYSDWGHIVNKIIYR